MEKQKVVLRRAGEGDHLSVVGDIYRVLAWGSETNGRYALIDATIPPGGGPPPHVHLSDEESFYITSGILSFRADGCHIQAGSGDFVAIPAGTEHTFKNEGTEPVRCLIQVAPAGLDNYFKEVGIAIQPGDPAVEPKPADFEKLIEAAPRYGVEIRLPPPP